MVHKVEQAYVDIKEHRALGEQVLTVVHRRALAYKVLKEHKVP